MILTTDYGRPERKQPSLHGRKINPNPNLSMAAKYFVCHISPIFQISLIYSVIGCPQSVIVKHNKSDTVFPQVIFSPEKFPSFNGYLVHILFYIPFCDNLVDNGQGTVIKINNWVQKNKNPLQDLFWIHMKAGKQNFDTVKLSRKDLRKQPGLDPITFTFSENSNHWQLVYLM